MALSDEQEVWLHAYCAALNGATTRGHTRIVSELMAQEAGHSAIKHFQTEFPSFRFHSNETGIPQASPVDPIHHPK